jgi:hypothetical protein
MQRVREWVTGAGARVMEGRDRERGRGRECKSERASVPVRQK